MKGFVGRRKAAPVSFTSRMLMRPGWLDRAREYMAGVRERPTRARRLPQRCHGRVENAVDHQRGHGKQASKFAKILGCDCVASVAVKVGIDSLSVKRKRQLPSMRRRADGKDVCDAGDAERDMFGSLLGSCEWFTNHEIEEGSRVRMPGPCRQPLRTSKESRLVQGESPAYTFE